MATGTPGPKDRQRWMSVLAKAPADRLITLFDGAVPRPTVSYLRHPEIGSVMVRGRMGGTGGAFNLGEMTVARCSVMLAGGETGHGYVQGRSKPAAEVAAIVDALMQTSAAEAVEDAVIAPLAAEAEAGRAARAGKAAATKVDFFTLVRGENA
ncbi:MAG: phosphonate C-P lyase system protein PhnG [Pseudomonadota bacterium]